MKNGQKGFTLIEILVAIAITTIMLGMVAQIIQITTKSNEKEKTINEIDTRLGKTVELIKRTARMAKKTGDTEATMGIIVSNENKTITMQVPVGEETITNETVIFEFTKATDKKTGNITVKSGDAETTDVIATNVEDAKFEKVEILKQDPLDASKVTNEGILRIYIKINLNKTDQENKNWLEDEKWKVKEIRDAAVTRLDVE